MGMRVCQGCFGYVKRIDMVIFQKTEQLSSSLCSSCYSSFIKEHGSDDKRKIFKWGNLSKGKSNELELEPIGDIK